MNPIFTEIEAELNRLAGSVEYRKGQKVWAEDIQFKNMRKLLSKAKSLTRKDVNDLCRVVSDSASLNSTIFQLVERLAAIVVEKSPPTPD